MPQDKLRGEHNLQPNEYVYPQGMALARLCPDQNPCFTGKEALQFSN